MNVKKVLILIINVLLSTLAYSQQKKYLHQDTVYVDGYYIIRYKKNEIIHKQKNLKLKEEGKSFEIMIDYETYPYYFSTKLNKQNVFNQEIIANLISIDANYKNLEVFRFPPYNNDKNIDSLFHYYNVIPENKQLFNKEAKEVYYTIKSDDIHLYRICHIQGYALRIPINMDWDIVLANKWNIIPTFINKKISGFYIYNFYNYANIDWNPTLPGFTEWK